MKQYTFKDGTRVIASSVEEAKAKHKVMAAGYSSDWNKEKDVLNKNGFKISVDKYNGHVYAKKRMPGHKSVYAYIYKTAKGTFEIDCYVDDVEDKVTDCVYESNLREVDGKKKTIKESIDFTNTYFKLVEKCINIHKKYEEDIKEINKEAFNLK